MFFVLYSGIFLRRQTSHEGPIRAMAWTHSDEFLLSGCDSGIINVRRVFECAINSVLESVSIVDTKRSLLFAEPRRMAALTCQCSQFPPCRISFLQYWTCNLNNKRGFKAHQDQSVRDISIAPSDVKFVTASDDMTVKLWDFETITCERTFKGVLWCMCASRRVLYPLTSQA